MNNIWKVIRANIKCVMKADCMLQTMHILSGYLLSLSLLQGVVCFQENGQGRKWGKMKLEVPIWGLQVLDDFNSKLMTLHIRKNKARSAR